MSQRTGFEIFFDALKPIFSAPLERFGCACLTFIFHKTMN